MSKFQSKEHRKKITDSRKKSGWFRNLKITQLKMSFARKGEKHPLFGKHHSESSKGKMRKSMLGRVPWNKGLGNLTSEAQKIRSSIRYRLWRESVFTRDNYTCVGCGQRGGRLQADHIKPFALFPKLRFILDNGRTLCVDCHKKTPTYGNRNTRTCRKIVI